MALVGLLPAETEAPHVYWETRVMAKGEEGGKEVEYSLSSFSGGDKVPQAGLRTAIAAVMVGRGQIKGTGILMPEICIPAEQYLDELAKTGAEEIDIRRKVKL